MALIAALNVMHALNMCCCVAVMNRRKEDMKQFALPLTALILAVVVCCSTLPTAGAIDRRLRRLRIVLLRVNVCVPDDVGMMMLVRGRCVFWLWLAGV